MQADFENVDWASVASQLLAHGSADLGPVLTPRDARALIRLYERPERFRSRIVMRRHGFGEGEYRYFAYPLPETVGRLRTALYPPLARIANAWEACLGSSRRYPRTHDEMLARCHAAGQCRPTPLLLRYGPGDHNCLHQDLHGEQVFPLQVVVLLNRLEDFSGGEFVITEQRPRMQSRVEVVPLTPGHAVVFPVNVRPRQGARGVHRVRQRHGVSRIRSGVRHTLGLVFHDAA